MKPTLARLYDVADLAREIGWPRRRLLRYLQRLNAERGGEVEVLVNFGTKRMPRWCTTKEVLPESWRKDMAAVDARLEELEAQAERQGEVLNAATTQIAVLARSYRALKTRADLLEANLRAVLKGSSAA